MESKNLRPSGPSSDIKPNKTGWLVESSKILSYFTVQLICNKVNEFSNFLLTI